MPAAETGSRLCWVRFVVLEHQSALAPRRVVGVDHAALGSSVQRNDCCADGNLRPWIRIFNQDASLLHSSAGSAAIISVALLAAIILAHPFGS